MKFRLLFWMRGKGRAGSSPRGTQHRLDLALEILLEPRARLRAPLRAPQQRYPFGGQRRQQQLVQAAVLVGDQLRGALVDRVELLGDRHAVGGELPAAELLQLLQARDADLEELIEVAAGDAQELQPLEQRHRFVERLVEHPLVELEERQFAVDVVLRSLEIRRVHRTATGCDPAQDDAAEPGSAPRRRHVSAGCYARHELRAGDRTSSEASRGRRRG